MFLHPNSHHHVHHKSTRRVPKIQVQVPINIQVQVGVPKSKKKYSSTNVTSVQQISIPHLRKVVAERLQFFMPKKIFQEIQKEFCHSRLYWTQPYSVWSTVCCKRTSSKTCTHASSVCKKIKKLSINFGGRGHLCFVRQQTQ